MKYISAFIKRHATQHQFVMVIIFLLTYHSSACQNSTINRYIDTGLDNNLNIQQQNLTLEQSLYHLAIAKGMFYPTLRFQSDYTYASGGRTFVLPIGDLLNPAYNTLNQLTGSSEFGNVQNQEFNLSANDYYDNKLELSVYLVNIELAYNKSIKKEVVTQRQAEVTVYKRTLVRDIKIAYYNIVMVQHQLEIFKNVDQQLNDNYEMTKSRVRNGRATAGDSLQILSDINDNKAKWIDAETRLKTTQAYLDFLINESLTRPVTIDTTGFREATLSSQTVPPAEEHEREEIAALRSLAQQSFLAVKMRRTAYLPVVSTYLNVGYQSTHFKVNNDTQYALGGLSLKWDLFTGFQNRNKIRAAKADAAIADSKIAQSAKQYEYLMIAAENELQSAQAQLVASYKNLAYLQGYYRKVKSRYDQGIGLLVELNDALTQLTNGRLNYALYTTTVLIKKAEVERTTAAYPVH